MIQRPFSVPVFKSCFRRAMGGYTFTDLLNRCQSLTAKSSLTTEVRLGRRISTLTGEELEANEAGTLRFNHADILEVMGGSLNLVDSSLDGPGWSSNSGRMTVTTLTGGETTLSFDAVSADIWRYTYSTGLSPASASLQIRYRSGTFDPDSYVAIRNFSTIRDRYDLQNLPQDGEWHTIDLDTTDLSTELVFRGTSTVFAIDVRYVRCTQTKSKVPPFGINTNAGETNGNDVCHASPVWPNFQSAVGVFVPYSWSGVDNPFAIDPVIHDIDPDWLAKVRVSGADMIVTGSNQAPVLTLGANDISSVSPNAISHGFDGVNVYGAWRTGSVFSAAETDLPTGDISLGTLSDGSKPLHGALWSVATPYALGSPEILALKAGMVSVMSEWLDSGGFLL